MRRYWCGVVSREHIKRGEAGGFCQVCHGKRGPLERMAVGDGIVFYSPVTKFQGNEKCQKFTAIGRIVGASSYPFKMSEDFVPFRRDVQYFECGEALIQPLLDELEFTRGKTNWGYKFRFGHFEISEVDYMLIAQKMLPDAALQRAFSEGDGAGSATSDEQGSPRSSFKHRVKDSRRQADLFAGEAAVTDMPPPGRRRTSKV